MGKKNQKRDRGEKPTVRRLSWRKFEGVSKSTIELGEFECRQGGNEVSQLGLEHQRQEIASDRAGTWQAVFRPQLNFGGEAENFPVNRGADHGRYIIVFGDKGPGYNDVKSWFRSTRSRVR